MNGKQNVVAAGGLGLILANFWLGGARKTVTAGTINKGATTDQTAAAHLEIKKFAGELLFVGVAVLLSGWSDTAGSAMIAVIVALFILWAINHFG